MALECAASKLRGGRPQGNNGNPQHCHGPCEVPSPARQRSRRQSRRRRPGRPLAHHRAHRRPGAARVVGRRRVRGPCVDVRAAPRPARARLRGRRRRGRARDRHRAAAADLRPRAVLARRAERRGAAATSATTTPSGATASRRRTSAAPRGRSTTSTAASRSSRASCRARASPRSTTRARSCSPTTAGSARATAAASTSTSSPTARLRRRAARVLRRLGPHAGAPALGARQLVEPLPPLQRRRLPRAARPLRGRGPAVLGRGARHGLAPGRTRCPPQLRPRLDRLQLGARAVPRPGGVPRRAAPPRACGSRSTSTPPTACARSRTPTRRWPRRSGAIPTAASRSPSTSPTPRSSTPTSRSLHHPLEAQGVDFWWIDWQQGPHSRIAGIDPLWMLNHFHFLDSGRERPAAADLLPLRRPGQPPLPGRVLRRHAHLVGVAGLPARVHRDRVEHRLRLVEPRHRRPHLRRARRRAGHPLGAARRVLADPAAALVEQPVPRQGAVAVPARGRAPRWATRCASATASCRTCTR